MTNTLSHTGGTRTGSIFPNHGVFEHLHDLEQSLGKPTPPHATPVDYDRLENSVVRDVLCSWDETLRPTALDMIMRVNPALDGAHGVLLARLLAKPTVFVGHWAAMASERELLMTILTVDTAPQESEPTAGTATLSPLDAVAFVRDVLGVPVRDALSGMGVRDRTYYAWKAQPDVQPRLASQGALWKYVQVCEDLVDVLGDNVATWVAADEHRRERIVEGDVDRLLEDALAEQHPPVEWAGPVAHAASGVEVPRVSPRRATTARRVKRADRGSR